MLNQPQEAYDPGLDSDSSDFAFHSDDDFHSLPDDDSLSTSGKIALCLAYASSSFAGLVCIPFIPFMIKDFFPELSLAQIGTRSGILASAFFLGRCVSSIPWGYFADSKGRRPSLLISLFLCPILAIVFGMAQSFEWALIVRFVWGCSGNAFGLTRTCMGESSSEESRVRNFSYLGLADLTGKLLGSIVGGILSEPASKFGGIFDVGFFREYKYFLPVSIAGALYIVSFIMCAIFLPETKQHTGPSLLNEGGSLPTQTSIWDLMKDRKILSATLSTGLNGWTMCVFKELLPLWVILPTVTDGFNFSNPLIFVFCWWVV